MPDGHMKSNDRDFWHRDDLFSIRVYRNLVTVHALGRTETDPMCVQRTETDGPYHSMRVAQTAEQSILADTLPSVGFMLRRREVERREAQTFRNHVLANVAERALLALN